jgi:hypothetical protein
MYKNQRFWRIFPLSNVQLEWNSASWTATTMDNLYVYCQLAINRFISREKNFVTHKQQCLQAVDCNDIRFQDGKRIHTLGAQSVHTRWILKLKSPCELLHFMRQVTAVACCFCICFAETRIQILSDDVESVTKISWVNYWVLGGHHIFPISFDSGFICSWKTTPFATCGYLDLLLNKIQPQFIFVNKLSIVFRLLDMDQDCLSPTCDWWFLIGVPVQMLLIPVATLTVFAIWRPKSPLPEGHTPTAHSAI